MTSPPHARHARHTKGTELSNPRARRYLSPNGTAMAPTSGLASAVAPLHPERRRATRLAIRLSRVALRRSNLQANDPIVQFNDRPVSADPSLFPPSMARIWAKRGRPLTLPTSHRPDATTCRAPSIVQTKVDRGAGVEEHRFLVKSFFTILSGGDTSTHRVLWTLRPGAGG